MLKYRIPQIVTLTRIFELNHADSLTGKHILIVDDVLTTGATTIACASRLAEVEGTRTSVLTLAMAD